VSGGVVPCGPADQTCAGVSSVPRKRGDGMGIRDRGNVGRSGEGRRDARACALNTSTGTARVSLSLYDLMRWL
jgi:hypothetical protein